MSKSEQIHKLIHSMTRTEKRYFKLHVKRHYESSVSEHIFDSMNSVEAFDEGEIYRELQGEAYHEQRSASEFYLFERLVESLVLYNQGKNAESAVYNMIREAEVLLNKGLHVSAIRRLEKAEKEAERNELFRHLLDIYHIYRGYFSEREIYGEAVDALLEKETTVLNKLVNISNYKKISRKIFSVLRRGDILQENDLSEIQMLLENPLLKSKDNASSFSALAHYYNIQSAVSYALQNTNETYLWTREHVQLFEDNPKKIADNPKSYVDCLHNHAHTCYEIKEYREMSEVFQKMEKVRDISAPVECSVFLTKHSLETLAMLHNRDKDNILQRAKEIRQGLTHYNDMLAPNDKTILSARIAELLYIAEEYTLALQWVNDVLNEFGEREIRSDVFETIAILNLCIHYCLGHLSLVNNLCSKILRHERMRKFPKLELQQTAKLLVEVTADSLTKRQRLEIFIVAAAELSSDNAQSSTIDSLKEDQNDNVQTPRRLLQHFVQRQTQRRE